MPLGVGQQIFDRFAANRSFDRFLDVSDIVVTVCGTDD